MTCQQAALAQTAPAAAAAAAPACYPACRDGFICHEGSCISSCNPPCSGDLECVDGRRCLAPAASPAGPPVYEPPPPPRASFAERTHSLFAFHLGFPGTLTADGHDGDAATTLGFNLRSDVPIAGYVLLGPMLQFGAWSADQPEAKASYYVDLDLVVRLRLPIETSKLNYQLWVGMPIGFTLDILGGDQPDLSTLGFGWNVGALLGGALHFTPKFGLFAETGWLQHKLTHSGDVVQDLDVTLQQWCLNLGIIVKS